MVQADEQVRTYGGWRRSRGMGLMGLGSAQTLMVLIALTALIISVSVNATVGLVVAGPALLLIGGTVLRWDGVPLLHGVLVLLVPPVSMMAGLIGLAFFYKRDN